MPLHERKRQPSEDEIQNQLSKRFKKEELNDPELEARARNVLNHSKDKYVASQMEQIKQDNTNKPSDINSLGDFNNYKQGNRRYAAQMDSAKELAREDQAEENKIENTTNELSKNRECRPPAWTEIVDSEKELVKEKTISWTLEANKAPRPEPNSKEAETELAQRKNNLNQSPFKIPNPAETPELRIKE